MLAFCLILASLKFNQPQLPNSRLPHRLAPSEHGAILNPLHQPRVLHLQHHHPLTLQPVKPATGVNARFFPLHSSSLEVRPEIFGLLTDIPADTIALEETGKEGYGICENHNAYEDQESATHKGHATKIGAHTFEITQEGIHAESC